MRHRSNGGEKRSPAPIHTDRTPSDAQAVQDSPSLPELVSKRTIALVLLCVQNASVSLLTRLSRTSSGPLYEPAVAVFTAELLKAAVSLCMLARQRQLAMSGKEGQAGYLWHARRAVGDLFGTQKLEMLKLAIPAALYALQNTLLLKLLTTALFSILFFRRSLSVVKWFSLLLLTVGVAIVQLESNDMSASTARLRGSAGSQDPRKGFAAILAACVSSGLAGAWFEWVLKSAPAPSRPPQAPSKEDTAASDSPRSPRSPPLALRKGSPTLWARNLQLSVPSLVFSFAGVLLCAPVSGAYAKGGVEGALAALGGMWDGFNSLVWGVVLNQALGGLLVAMVVRFADSVAKGFATSIAIVLSTLASAVLFSLVPGRLFLLGAGLVTTSTVLYSLDKD
ncbi:hypothetical protein JCM10450v2_005002 [Rhodotorula kratochvilovae]